ncbi:sigma-70 family RNA polymerase sigma factor [Thermosipho ferrireducens]|uniref:Sigma-70 family RNA polymerase sigma factor n=1 Tax=Thermosipho ferrireducens TaxID=2571116 RepID=A0ABX7SA18_9BACT|nr:sigma-70 family RNA polymerase sigma factor [Thermosipho ferrireducens]QTA38796.1 sigma-70 family RNA polymerase sigma factor [Thermosipho ferrireducens]
MKKDLSNYINNNILTERFLETIQNIVSKIVHTNPYYLKTLLGKYGNKDSIIDEITNNILIKIKEKKDLFLKCEKGIEGYLYTMIKNHIVDILRKSRETYSLDKEIYDGEENMQERFIYDIGNVNPESEIIAEAFVEELNQMNIQHLCYYFYKSMYSKEILFKEKSASAKYKIVERIKKKLRELVLESGISEIEFSIAIRKFMSETCEKIRNDNMERN